MFSRFAVGFDGFASAVACLSAAYAVVLFMAVILNVRGEGVTHHEVIISAVTQDASVTRMIAPTAAF